MQPLFFVRAIMGGADGSAGCAEARVEQAQYRTMQQCQAAMPAVLERNTDLSFPTISAACRATGMRMADQRATPERG